MLGLTPARSQHLAPPTEPLAGEILVNAIPEPASLESTTHDEHSEPGSPELEPPAPNPEIGWEFSGQRELNATTISEQEYYGDCPGRQRNYIRARFFSSEMPPADRRRVVVRNITRGLDDDPFPYTDREYDEGRSSEATKMRFGTKHSGRYFHVLPGMNEFEYEIKARRRGPVLKTGTFTAEITRDLQRIQRDATYGEDEVCANDRVDLDVCADVRDRQKWSCPDGSIIRSELFPDDSRVITEIHNHTDHTIEVSINGRMRRIFPGSYYDFDNRYPSIRYESNGERRSRSLTSGTRYRFYEKDGQVRIEEYRRHSRW
ncbi:MAG: hypothetical protein F6J87_22275 [Spirulina sp. SIO3F2]|nr:hypothetical protein [Spirulina sp. SIO3F2]